MYNAFVFFTPNHLPTFLVTDARRTNAMAGKWHYSLYKPGPFACDAGRDGRGTAAKKTGVEGNTEGFSGEKGQIENCQVMGTH